MAPINEQLTDQDQEAQSEELETAEDETTDEAGEDEEEVEDQGPAAQSDDDEDPLSELDLDDLEEEERERLLAYARRVNKQLEGRYTPKFQELSRKEQELGPWGSVASKLRSEGVDPQEFLAALEAQEAQQGVSSSPPGQPGTGVTQPGAVTITGDPEVDSDPDLQALYGQYNEAVAKYGTEYAEDIGRAVRDRATLLQLHQRLARFEAATQEQEQRSELDRLRQDKLLGPLLSDPTAVGRLRAHQRQGGFKTLQAAARDLFFDVIVEQAAAAGRNTRTKAEKAALPEGDAGLGQSGDVPWQVAAQGLQAIARYQRRLPRK
jgi:hypothetical protein